MKPQPEQFTAKEWRIIQSCRTPLAVQRYLMTIPYNGESVGAFIASFRRVIQENHVHCLEGALVAATILEQHGYPPLLVSIESQDQLDHVLFLYQQQGKYGAVARSRDIALHGRKPVFRTVRDLVMSYYDPYIDGSGRIIGYALASLHELGNYDWRFSARNIKKVERHLLEIPHRRIRGSEARYQRALRRYQAFRRQHPDRSPDYFPTRNVWLR
ncbi:MAG: hypothetical protein V7641_3308 [Blastocatellia bacterium]